MIVSVFAKAGDPGATTTFDESTLDESNFFDGSFVPITTSFGGQISECRHVIAYKESLTRCALAQISPFTGTRAISSTKISIVGSDHSRCSRISAFAIRLKLPSIRMVDLTPATKSFLTSNHPFFRSFGVAP